jgi:hypothetical protein
MTKEKAPQTESAVHINTFWRHFSGSAIIKGISSTSGGTGKNEFYIKAMPNNA